MLRLIYVEMRPVYAEDDGTDLSILEGDVFQVKASEIAGFPAMWAEQFALLQETHDEEVTSE